MIILTGGAGFIGSVTLAHLNDLGHDNVLVADHLGESQEKWKNLQGKRFFDYIHKDKLLPNLISGGLGKITHVIHLGACSSTTESNADYLYQNNTSFSKTLAEYSITKGIRFIYASSAATYGAGEYGYDDSADIAALKPLNMYGFSKHVFDDWLVRSGRIGKTVGLKFFNVYGPNEYHKGRMASVVMHSFKQILAEGKVRLFKSYRPDYKDGEQKRDFVYVKDCARVVGDLLNNNTCGLFNLGSGKARSWNDLANSVFAALGKTPSIEYIDMPEDLRGQYQYFTEAKMSKLAAKVPAAAERTSLEDGVRDYVQNYLSKNFARA
jgi:ADP-L-glycero-D-manno-heptose 6-epimerase